MKEGRVVQLNPIDPPVSLPLPSLSRHIIGLGSDQSDVRPSIRPPFVSGENNTTCRSTRISTRPVLPIERSRVKIINPRTSLVAA